MRLNFFHPLIAITTISSISFPASANPYQYKPWVNPDVLANDHRAYCSDIVAQNTRSDIESYERNNTGSNRNSNHHSQVNSSNQIKKGGGQASVKIFGIGLGGGGNRERQTQQYNSNQSHNSSSATWDRSRRGFSDHSTITSVTAGKDCADFVNAAADVEINQQQQQTNRMAIQTQERVRNREIRSNEQQFIFNNLLQGW